MLVTLLTDFGTADYFVAAMKGVILARDPSIRLVDVTHHVPPHDVRAAAFQLLAVYRSFPPGTVHLVVVDPGVGTDRRPLAIRAGDHFFVGPDNGAFDLALDDGPVAEVRRLSDPTLRREPVSPTFHGRDLFAPAAAALATGFPFDQVGEVITDRVRLPRPFLPEPGPDEVIGEILHVDRFGNCLTSIRPEHLPGGVAAYRFVLPTRTVEEVRETFAGPASNAPFVLVGSAGFLEIALDRAHAAGALGLGPGDVVRARKRV